MLIGPGMVSLSLKELELAEDVQYKHQFTGSFGGVYKFTIINKLENLTSDVITIQGEMATFSYSTH